LRLGALFTGNFVEYIDYFAKYYFYFL